MVWLCSKEEFSLKYSDLICLHNYDYNKEMYIHQLQNLIHALTGKEMELKK